MISTGFGDVSMTGNIEYPTRNIQYRSGANSMSPNPKKGVILIRRLAEKDLAYSYLHRPIHDLICLLLNKEKDACYTLELDPTI